MNRETEVNIKLLECLGWFIAESDMLEEEEYGFILECCEPDGTSHDNTCVTDYTSLYFDEQHGGLEERLWFFAPQVSTSSDALEKLLEDKTVEYTKYREVDYKGDILYEAAVQILAFDEEENGYVNLAVGNCYNAPLAALAVAEAYLNALEKLEETELNEHDRN